MRTRAERNRGFESVKQNLFDAGVAVLNAAEAQEQLFDASVKALAEAIGVEAEEDAEIDSSADGLSMNSSMNSIVEKLMVQRQEAETAGDFDSYVNAEQKLQTLEELEVAKLEREARKLEAQIRIKNAQKQLSLPSQTPKPITSELEPEPQMLETWTESKLKEKFKTLDGVRKAFSIKAKSWKEAVDLTNRRKD